MKLTHRNCQDAKCSLCLKEHLLLGDELDKRTGIEGEDHLGKFHKWLTDQGITAETEWGWGSDAYFDEKNISAYVATWVESRG